jgi:hypothetical protein
MRNIKIFIFFTLFSFGISSCKKDSPQPQIPERGRLISASIIGEYTVDILNAAILAEQIPLTHSLKYPVKGYKIRYETTDFAGNSTIASGTVFIPTTADALPLMSFQHGTQTKRTEVASSEGILATEGFVGCMAASLGYVCCVPDYLGLGDSQMLHPFLVANVSASAIIDLMTAVKTYCTTNLINLNQQVFIGGYSEGGFVTLAAQRELEKNYIDKFTLTASAPMAGPYDTEYTANSIFSSSSYSVSGYVGFLLDSYSTYFKFADLNQIFMPAYVAKIQTLYNGTKTITEINSELTTNVNELLLSDFFTNYIQNTNSTFWTTVKQNSLLGWKPLAHTYLIQSDADEIVPYQNSVNALADFQNHGSTTVELITLNGLSHSDAAIPAVLKMIDKFEALRVK